MRMTATWLSAASEGAGLLLDMDMDMDGVKLTQLRRLQHVNEILGTLV